MARERIFLSSVQKELAAVRCAKTALLKQGMMLELLTGKARLGAPVATLPKETN